MGKINGIGFAGVNPTSSLMPYNESESFVDSPIEILPPMEGFEGFGGFQTKLSIYSIPPSGGVVNYDNFGVKAMGYNAIFNTSSVSLGDFDNNYSLGQFYWYSGQALTEDSSGNPFNELPFGVSGIVHNTNGYNLLNVTYNFFKIDAKTGNPSNVDGLLFNLDSGIMGFGRGLDANSRSSFEESICWDVFGGNFNIRGVMGSNVLYSNSGAAQTFIFEGESSLGLESGAMYISEDLIADNEPRESTKVLNVRDSNGNSYQIKLWT